MSTKFKKVPYRLVKEGDPVFSCDYPEFMGIVLGKGNFKSLIEEGFESPCSEKDFEWDGKPMEKLLAISQDPNSSSEGYASIIMAYDVDPSSAIVLLPKQIVDDRE